MTTYRLKTSKEGEVKKEGNFTYKFINGEWRIIHYKYNKFEYWQEYDNKGHLIHFKNNNGLEYWCEYDDKGNNIYYKDDEFECWREYDDKGHLIHYKNNKGLEKWYNDKREKITKEEFNKIWEKVE